MTSKEAPARKDTARLLLLKKLKRERDPQLTGNNWQNPSAWWRSPK
jgi:hypothetical protein